MSDKKLQAKNLYFQTALNKTQIANLLKISRRTLHYWIREGSWQRLKLASETMPSIIAENCYHILRHMSELHLSERRLSNPITPKEVDAMHKMVLTITKLKGRAVLNESMEMFGYFFEKLNTEAPQLAEALTPFVDKYLSERAELHPIHVQPPHLNDLGYIPFNHDQPDTDERQLDNHDHIAWDAERYNAELDETNSPWPKIEVPEEQPLPNPYSSILTELEQETRKQNLNTGDTPNYKMDISEMSAVHHAPLSCHGEHVEPGVGRPVRRSTGDSRCEGGGEVPWGRSGGATTEQKVRNPESLNSVQPVEYQSKPLPLPHKKIFSSKVRNRRVSIAS